MRVLVAAAITFPLAGVLFAQSRQPQSPAIFRETHAQPSVANYAFSVEPLEDAELWAVAAVKCRLRDRVWSGAVTRTIESEAGYVAQAMWRTQPTAANAVKDWFKTQLKHSDRRALTDWHSDCAVLLSSGELSTLDQMAKAGGW